MFSSKSKVSCLYRLLGRSLSSPLIIKESKSNSVIKSSIRECTTSEGGTYVTILNNEQTAPIMINSYSGNGFRLNNGLFVIGPIALFPQSILSWNISGDEDINERSLSLFLHLFPKLDVLLIGLSDPRNQKLLLETRSNIHNMLKNFPTGEKINVDVMPTEKAVSTFNFLTSEMRFVGAALIPPTHYTPSPDDEYRTAYLTKKKKDGDFIASE